MRDAGRQADRMRFRRPPLFDIEVALPGALVLAGALSSLWSLLRFVGFI